VWDSTTCEKVQVYIQPIHVIILVKRFIKLLMILARVVLPHLQLFMV
jgi:hypothetical protein